MINIAEKLNLVIDYIENRLTGEIDQEEIARIACLSYYDVARAFSLIADISISDYVRKRRLTLAGAELKRKGAKVTDTALKYGYDSPVSFARAFREFHGFSPSDGSKDSVVPKEFPRLIYQICVKEVACKMDSEVIQVNGKEYKASYLGKADMSSWSDMFSERKFWRLEDAYDDFKDKPMLEQVLPYNNYPPINIETGQVFVIDYFKKDGGAVERKYYISDGTVWNDMTCTREFVTDYMEPIRVEKISVGSREYDASCFGERDMSYWSDFAVKRVFWRLECAEELLKNCEYLTDVLPYNNYPPIKIEDGQVFAIDYHKKDGTTERRYYAADGTVWRGMPSTRQFVIKE